MRGASGGRGEVHADFLGLQDFDERAEDGRFAGTGSSGKDGGFVGEGVFERGALLVGEGEAGFVFGPRHGGVDFDRRESADDAADADDGVGNFHFGAVEHGQLDQTRTRQWIGDPGRLVADELVRLDEGGDADFEEVRGGFEEWRGVLDEIGFADGGMAFFLERIHGEEQAGVEAWRGVVGETEVNGDFIGGFETDAVDLAGNAVRFAQENLFRLVAVARDELHALRSRDAVGLEKNVDLAEGALVVPGFFDGGGAALADAGHGAQAGGFFAEDAKRIGAEGVDDFVGVDLADAWDEAAAEVFADAIDAGR